MLGLQIVSTITSFFTPIDTYIISPLKEHISYVLDYTKNVAELRHKVEILAGARDNLQNSVHDACRRGDEIQKNVQKWLADADKAIEEAEKLIQSEEEAKKNRCFAGLCPNLKARHRLGKKAAEEASAMVNLENEGKFDTSQISYRPAPQQIVSSSVHGFEGLPSRASILKQVMDAVTDSSVNVIGVYGMGGAGKTTLVKEVHKQAIEGKLFDVVALVTLSEKAQLERIQGTIAEVLGLKLEEETIEVRANRLHQRLMKEKKVLIILDNLWGRIDLESLGIPLTNEQWVSSRGAASIIEQEEDDHKACTVLLTSRVRNLLTRDMGAQKVFVVDVLPEKESWTLFKSMAGDIKIPRLQSIAIQVAKKCAGLPLLLVTVASALKKNKEFEVWEDTLKRLSTVEDEEMQERVYSVIELSYDRLATKELQSFFLLCGLFTYADILILHLLKYSMGLGLLRQINTVHDARNRVHKLIGELKSSCLLLDSEEDGCVKIHDVVQDVATSIAFRDQLAFKKVGGSLEECQSVDFKCFTRIFLADTNISEFHLGWQCPEIEFFCLSVRDHSAKIPDSFFEGIAKLRVLDFIGMCFLSLPPSLGSATSLHTLCLFSCQLQDISVICQLKNLEVLSLVFSEIIELPRNLVQLTQLKLLDLSNCSKLEIIPENILSRLSLLEELHMGNSFTGWEVKRLDKSNASLSELKHLSRLTCLEIDVPDASKLPKELFSERLERFKISIGGGWGWWGSYKTSRGLKLKLHTSFHDWGQGVKILLKKVEDLYLDGVKGVKNVLYDIQEEGFPQLKHLLIQKGRDIQYVIDSKMHSTSKAFPVLESLILHQLVNLEKISRGQLMAGDFCQLKILRVESCNKLKNLFPFSMIRNLKQLLEMEVIDCSDIEEIFTGENGEEESDKNEVFEFTQLYSLKLQLPLLRSFCSKVKSSPASTSSAHPRQNQSTIDPQCPLFNDMVVFPNLKDLKLSSIAVENIWWDGFKNHASFHKLTSMTVEACSKINSLFTSEMVNRNLEQLQRLEIYNCKSMKGVIAAEGETISKTLFPNLESLKLKSLLKLVRFCSGGFIELPSLKELWIENCPTLKSFISNPTATTTSEANLALFNKKVVFPDLEELHLEDMSGLKMIWQNELHEGSFCKLKTMIVRRAEKLESVFPSNMLMSRFINLERLDVTNCELIEEVFDLPPQEQLINFSRLHGIPASQLKKLRIRNLLNLKHIWKNDVREREIIFFQKLHDVDIHGCPSLQSIFPATIATHLSELEELTISYCGIEEIIDRGGDTEASSQFEFPKLTTLRLSYLKELKTLYPRTHTSDWPMLKKLEVCGCPKMEIFSLESQSIGGKSWSSQLENPSRQPLFIVEKVIPSMAEWTLDSKAAKSILNGNLPDNLFQKVMFLSLRNFDKESASVLFALLGRFPNLESLHVENRGSRRLHAVTELFSCEGLINEENQGRTIPRIKHMKLKYLDKLKRFCKQDCQLDRIFESLETLKVSRCDSLISLGPSINIASFGNLSRLDVRYCDGLLNLVTSSTAQCLGLLTELCIRLCSMVNEVVAREEDDREEQITLGNLKSLKLCYLESLTYFCSAYHTFNFPSLEELIIEQCPKMKAFSRGVSITPKLKKVKLAKYSDKERWEGDLNTTIQQLCAELVTFDGIRHLKLSEYPQLKEKWHSDELPAKFFSNLMFLIVDECASSSTAIPFNLLPFLDELWELEVQNCDLVEEVFDLTLPNDADAPIGTLPKLRKLQLIDLPRLKHVWNEEPKGVFDFRNLGVIKIHNCPTLKYIFTPTTCLGLVKLGELEVKDCPLIEEIISNEATTCNVEFFPGQAMELEVKNCTSVEEIITSGEEEAVVNTMLSQLNSLVLESLPNLTSFCSSTNVLELQSLEEVTVLDCPRIELFASTILGAQEPNVVTNEGRLGQEGFSTPAVLLFGAKVACRNLKELKVECNNNTKGLLHGKFPAEYSAKIEVLELTNFPHEETLFPADILLRLPSLEKLVVNDADFGELFLEQRIVDKKNSDEQVTNLRQLTISKLPKVSQLFQDHSIPDLVIQNLETLEVIECIGLKILMPSSLSFQNLTSLEVSKCHGLTNLMTSSTARSLEKLTRMSITECDMMEEIVASEGNEGEDEIAFSQLKYLGIRWLPNLVGFCSQNHTFNFPLLEEVTLIECSKMKVFSEGTLYSPQLTEVQISQDEDQWRWEGSLNQTVQKLFLEMGEQL